MQGTYVGNFVYASTQFDNLAIDGGYTANCSARVADPVNTVLDGNNLGTVLIVVSQGTADVSIDNVTIQNGLSQTGPTTANGGGLHIDTPGLLTLSNNVFMNNSTPPSLLGSDPKGGAVYATGDVVLDNNVFLSNSARFGGGVYAAAVAVIDNNLFEINDAVVGGALYINGTSTLSDNIFNLNTAGVTAGAYLIGDAELIRNTFDENGASTSCSLCDGGALSAKNDATLTDNMFINNIGGTGGGANIEGVAELTGNNFTGNESRHGGALRTGPDAVLVNNIFINNSATALLAGIGGAVFLGQRATVVDNIFDGNTALGRDSTGGAGRIGGSSLFDSNTVLDNSATNEGGGILFTGNLNVVTNNVFAGNSASHGGAAHGLNNSVVTNNTITDNVAIVEGGGLWIQLVEDNHSLDLYNNIVWSNSAPSAADIYLDNNGNNSFFASSTNLFNNDFDQSAAGFVVNLPVVIDSSNLDNVDPMFVDDYHLQEGSPLIDVGDESAPNLPPLDKDGSPRVAGLTVDIGAYERPAVSFTGVVVLSDLNGNGSAEVCVLLQTQPGIFRAYVKDSGTGLPVSDIGFSGADAVGILSVDSNAVSQPLVGILGTNASGNVIVELSDPATGDFVRRLFYGATYRPIAATTAADLNSNGNLEVGVLGQNSAGSVRVRFVDSVTRTIVNNFWYGAPSKPPIDFAALPDANQSLAVEIGVLGENEVNQVRVQRKDGLTRQVLSSLWYGNTFRPQDLILVGDVDGNNELEVTVLGRNAAGGMRARMIDAVTGQAVGNVFFSPGNLPNKLVSLPDFSGNGNAELAALAQTTTGGYRVQVRDAFSGALIRNVWFDQNLGARDLIAIPDLNGNNASEVGVLGVTTSGITRLRIKDAADNTLIRDIDFP